MAVGRLPRVQRYVGGTTATATVTPPRKQPSSIRYPAVRWEATLREPAGVIPAGAGPMHYTIDVVGNIDLAGVPIDIGLEPRAGATTWHPAAWLTVDANRGTATATIRATPGRYTIVARPQAAGQQPTLAAGRLIIQ